MVQARRHYGKAITALNTALNDPVLTADDSILVTLFLLSLFEVRYFRLVLLHNDIKEGSIAVNKVPLMLKADR